MGRLIYFVKEALRGFFQAKLMTFVSIVTIAVTLFVLGLLAVAYLNVRVWLRLASARPGVVVFLADSVSADTAKAKGMMTRLAAMPQVASAGYVDKDSAWRRFEQLYGSQMLEAVDDNPLPASAEISLAAPYQSADAIDKFKQELAGIGGVEGVQYSREWVEALKKFRTWFYRGTIPLALFLALVLHFMIANTIKLTIYARRDLISNMRLVGATDSYIKTPFVLEGMLQGMIGGFFGVAALSIVRAASHSFPIVWGSWHLFFAIFLIGVFFGWIGSRSAVRKFLQ
jgi:cell division transport system permease protein